MKFKRYAIGIGLLIVGLVVGGFAISKALPLLRPKVVCPGDPNLSMGGTWTKGATMQIARAETASSAVGERIYVAGGMVTPWTATTDTQAYDSATDTWSEVAPMPLAVHHAGVATLNRRLYVSGGYDDMGKMVNALPDIDRAWYYDPEADTWTEIAKMPSPRAAHAMVSIDGKLYVVGGTGEGAQQVWVYDPETDAWTIKDGIMPTPREHVPAIDMDGKIYVIGGRWENISSAAVEVYDPATDTWEKKANLPTPRSALSLAVLNGLIHTAGGEELSNGCTYGLHETYDPATDTWMVLHDIPTPRHAMLSAVIDGKWYLLGGSTEAGAQTDAALSNVVDIFTPEK